MSFIKTVIIISCSLLFVNDLTAQYYNLEGKVYDQENSSPVYNAEIILSNGMQAKSESDGSFKFINLELGYYTIDFTHVNYHAKSVSVELISDSAITVVLHPKLFNLENVIVTSGKYEKNINDLSFPVSYITSTQVLKNPFNTVPELLQYEPGISLMKDGMWGTEISIRGLSRSNIVTLMDGNRIETANDLGARLSMIDMNDIERIEVVKGAASSLYGTGATGGIVNIISKSGTYQDDFYIKGNFTGGYNSVNNLATGGINVFSGDQSWSAKLSTFYREAENTKTPSGTLDNSQFKDYSFSSLVQIKTFENQELKFNYQQFKAEDVGIPGASDLFPVNATVRYPLELRRMIDAEYSINSISSLFNKLSLKYFNQFIRRDVENIPHITQTIPGAGGQPAKRVSVLEISPGADHNTNGLQVQSNITFDKNHFMIAGIDYWQRSYKGERSKIQKIEMINNLSGEVIKTINKTIVEKPLPDAEFNSAGIFIQDDLQLIDQKLSLTISGRFDYIWVGNKETKNPIYEITDGFVDSSPASQVIIWNSGDAVNNSYSYSAGIIYSYNDLLKLSFNAARSFRAPSLEERYQYIDLGSLVRLGDPQLEPETGNYFDAGIKFQKGSFRLNSNLFLNVMDNLVSEIPGLYEGRSALIKTNVSSARFYGFEINFDYQLSYNSLLYANASYVRGRNTSDESDLPQIPPLNGLLGVKTKLFDLFEIDFSGIAFDSQKFVAESEIPTPGYVYFNLFCNSNIYKIGLLNFRFSFGIENLLNKEYRNHLSTSRGLIKSEPGRNAFLRVNIQW
ncbi:MAG: TonB-dependent receptor [Melioribacteraceae bacterium]|nr:TonB-dependent receptor [Melioribacteraceae bacterium]